MNQTPQLPVPSNQPVPMDGDDGYDDFLDVRALLKLVMRRIRLLLTVGATVFAIVFILGIQAPKQYTATSKVVIDARPNQIIDLGDIVSSGLSPDDAIINTEVEILQSASLIGNVVDALNLLENDYYNPALVRPSLISQVVNGTNGFFSAIIRSATPDQVADPNVLVEEAVSPSDKIAQQIRGGLTVGRVGRTYAINIEYTSRSPGLSARIANEIARQYLTLQLEDKFSATKEASDYLAERVEELRLEAERLEAEAEDYRAQRNLFSVGSEQIVEQSLASLTARRLTLQSELSEGEARLTTLQAARRFAATSDAIEFLNSGVIQNLKAQRAELESQRAALDARYAPQHPTMLRIDRAISNIDVSIGQEARRIVQGVDREVAIARSKLANVEAEIGEVQGQVRENNASLVTLRSLERDAGAARQLYTEFLERLKQTREQQSLSRPDAKILATATVPERPSEPRLSVVFMMATMLAGVGAAGAVWLAEHLDDGLRDPYEVENKLGVACLGTIPVVETDGAPDGLLTALYHEPFSAQGESFRSLITTLRHTAKVVPCPVIAISSALPNEGKTSISLSLGLVASQLGQRVLVVDGDLRRCSVSDLQGERQTVGLVEHLKGDVPLDEAIQVNPMGMHVLPISTGSGTAVEILFDQTRLKECVASWREKYDLILIDLPPILAVAEARPLINAADGLLMVSLWRKTPVEAIENALRRIAMIDSNIFGLVLNQTPGYSGTSYGYGYGYGYGYDYGSEAYAKGAKAREVA
ncbi:MAG: AAA family ATPase [Pseudomonadota bacterium]